MQDDILLHTNTAMLSVDEALDDGAEDAVPPLIPRPATCSRPPCLKRNSSSSTGIAHSWPTQPFAQGDQPSSSSPSMPSMTQSDPQSQQRSISSPSAATASLRSYSFNKAPRSASESSSSSPTLSRRQVTFTAAPPESYDTHSADDYDRTQIECTPGGSAFDLRLSSRCKRYTGDGEEDDTEEDDYSSSLRSPPLSAHGNTGWTCLRGGSVIGSIDAPRHAFQEAHQSGEGELPSRGLRSFGGLARRGILSQEHEQEREHEQDAVEELAESDVDGSGTAESDLDGEAKGTDAFEAAAITSSSLTGKSPDATPKPSPSIVPRWARCTDYFSASPSPQMDEDAFPGSEVSTVESGANVSTATSSSPPVGLGFEQLTPQRPSSVETDAVSPQSTVVDGNSPVASTQSPSKVQSATSSAVPSPLLPQIDFNGTLATASSEEGNGGNSSHDAHPHSHSSPSPLSSRCSSVDPWGSLGCGSSSDEGGGGARSPMLEWSSCTSPEISPVKLGLETTQSTALTPKINHAGLANSTAFNHADLEEEPSETLLLPATSWSVSDSSSTILSSAVSRIQAERVTGHMSDHTSSPDEQDSPRGYFGDASESTPEAAEDTQALRVKPRRKSSSSSCTPSGRTSRERIRVTTVDEDGNTVTRSVSRNSSSTDTSPAMSRRPSSKLSISDRDQINSALSSHGGSLCASPSEEDPHHHHQLGTSSPSTTTTTTTTSTGTIKRKSRSASRSSSRSTSATMSRTSSWNTSIEDEGALGGF